MYNAVKNGNAFDFNYKKFICDTVDDMNAIDVSKTASGSTALIIETSEVYILSNTKEWKKWTSTSGGSANCITADDIATVSDTSGYLDI